MLTCVVFVLACGVYCVNLWSELVLCLFVCHLILVGCRVLCVQGGEAGVPCPDV